MYNEKVIEAFRNPKNVGEIENADGVGTVGNASCGDIMQISLKIENDIIVDAKFKTFGCAAAIATSSTATDMIIGMTVEEAKWWYMTKTILMGVTSTIDSGWSTYGNKDSFYAPLTGNNIQSTGLYKIGIDGNKPITFSAIPVVANTYGYIFVNILGAWDIIAGDPIEDLEISNLKIEFSREGYDIPTSLNVARPREMKVDRVTSKEYSASNSNESNEEWNADCIFASDNNMEYGYGLLLNYAGNIISKVRYGSSFQHPEQHLANRVATYWDSDKMRLDTELWNIGAVAGVSPDKTVSLAGVTGVPVAISHDWRDDLMKMVLIEL